MLDGDPEGGGVEDQGIGPESISLDDYEAPVVDEPKTILDDDNPRLTALREALRISEEARLAAQQAIHGREPAPTPARAPEPSGPRPRAGDFLTDEQLAELWEENPVKALRAVQMQTLKFAEEQYGPMLEAASSSGVGATEHVARAEFPDEFELFGKEIREFVAAAPNKAAFSSVDGWRDLVSYIRGKPGNIEKYVERLQNKKGPSPAVAREAERDRTGFTPRATAGGLAHSSTPDGDATYGLDPTERKVADTMGITYKDYAKWKRVQ